MKRPHLQPVCSEPPNPWQKIACDAVGGLLTLGFGENSDLLLVISSSGRGVFDCNLGSRMARDHKDDSYDPIKLEAIGIGPLSDKFIRMSGLGGGGLPTNTNDGWGANRFTLEWPLESLILTPPGSWVYGILYDKPYEFTKVYEDSEVRSWGFSPTGKTLILATSSDLTIYGRERKE